MWAAAIRALKELNEINELSSLSDVAIIFKSQIYGITL